MLMLVEKEIKIPEGYERISPKDGQPGDLLTWGARNTWYDYKDFNDMRNVHNCIAIRKKFQHPKLPTTLGSMIRYLERDSKTGKTKIHSDARFVLTRQGWYNVSIENQQSSHFVCNGYDPLKIVGDGRDYTIEVLYEAKD